MADILCLCPQPGVAPDGAAAATEGTLPAALCAARAAGWQGGGGHSGTGCGGKDEGAAAAGVDGLPRLPQCQGPTQHHHDLVSFLCPAPFLRSILLLLPLLLSILSFFFILSISFPSFCFFLSCLLLLLIAFIVLFSALEQTHSTRM